MMLVACYSRLSSGSCIALSRLLVTCNRLWSLAMYFTGRLHFSSSYRELVKDVLTCQPLVASTYKERYPDDMDDPEAVGASSEDEAEGMGEVLGISRRFQKPAPSLTESSTAKSSSAAPSDTATPAVPEEEGTIRVKRKDLRRAEGILKDILAGKRVRMSTGASCQDVPFEVPKAQAGERDCQLCRQSFKSTRSLKHHMKTHTGETGWSCSRCGKILASRAMSDLHLRSCGQEKGHWCQECSKGYTTKQALVAHLKAKHGPAPLVEELTCPTCGKIFKLIKTMREHLATHKGPFPCRVEGCQAGPFSLPKRLNWHLEKAHGFSARKE